MTRKKIEKNKNNNLTISLVKKYGTRDLVLGTRLTLLISVQAKFFIIVYYTFQLKSKITISFTTQ